MKASEYSSRTLTPRLCSKTELSYVLSGCDGLRISFLVPRELWHIKNTFFFFPSVDHSRICLQLGSNDYINASLITAEEAQRNYILTQVSMYKIQYTGAVMIVWYWTIYNCEQPGCKYCLIKRMGVGVLPVLWHIHGATSQ